MTAFRTIFLLTLTLGLPACGPTPKVVIIATVKTVDEAVDVFKGWAVREEDRIASEAVAKCQGAATQAAYTACTDSITGPRRAPINKAETAMKLYLDAIATASGVRTGNVLEAASALTQALADLGIKIGG